MSNLVEAFTKPDRIWTRAEVLASTSPVPAKGGVYGWWFRKLPAVIDTSGCIKRDGLTLLYVGISPQPPPLNGRAPSTQNSKMLNGLSGRPLADALYDFVTEAYPGQVFYYEKARVGLERTGVAVRGTGNTTRAALAGATDLFEHEPGRGGLWRWKERTG